MQQGNNIFVYSNALLKLLGTTRSAFAGVLVCEGALAASAACSCTACTVDGIIQELPAAAITTAAPAPLAAAALSAATATAARSATALALATAAAAANDLP